MRSDFSLNDRTLTSVGRMSTDIGLSDINEMVGQCSPSGQTGPPRTPVVSRGANMPPSEEFIAREKLPQ